MPSATSRSRTIPIASNTTVTAPDDPVLPPGVPPPLPPLPPVPPVATTTAVSVGAGVSVGEGVSVGDGVTVAVAVAVAVAVGFAVEVAVAVGVHNKIDVGLAVGVAVTAVTVTQMVGMNREVPEGLDRAIFGETSSNSAATTTANAVQATCRATARSSALRAFLARCGMLGIFFPRSRSLSSDPHPNHIRHAP